MAALVAELDYTSLKALFRASWPAAAASSSEAPAFAAAAVAAAFASACDPPWAITYSAALLAAK